MNGQRAPVRWPPRKETAVDDIVLRKATESLHCRTSRAVSRDRSSGNPAAFRVQADRFDHQIEFVGAVDLARYAVGRIGPDEVGFGEVVESINPLRIAVLHEDHGVRRIFRP